MTIQEIKADLQFRASEINEDLDRLDAFNEYSDNVITYYHESGIISQDEADQLYALAEDIT